jgi:hypothetical protein
MKKRQPLYLCIVLVVTLGVACTPSSLSSRTPFPVSPSIVPSPSPNEPVENSTPTSMPSATATIPVTTHLMRPADVVPVPGKWIDDVESSETGPEGRTPTGDSYKRNRFERPFLKDMTYVPDLDIRKFGLSEDEEWYYISIHLVGKDPNNPLDINYGTEIDLNADGLGDYIVWAHPPYTLKWDTRTVQVFQDSNLDTARGSALPSDAVFDGYDTLVFDGSVRENSDPDLAWVRMSGDAGATLQMAFKKSLSGFAFMLGVVSDAGLKDVSKFDYAIHFTEADIGSPVRSNKYYPLGLLYAVDNTCWEVYGFQARGSEPKLCQPVLQPVITQSPDNEACNPPPDCNGDEPGTGNYNPNTCECLDSYP